MPKQKTKKSAKRRVKITGTGKMMGFKPGKRHLNAGKSGGTIRDKGVGFVIAEADTRRMKLAFPYGDK